MPHPSPSNPLPRLALTTGDPLGIGPEVLAPILVDEALRATASFTVYGDGPAVLAASSSAGLEVPVRDIPCVGIGWDGSPTAGDPGPSPAGGEVSYRAFEHAIADAQAGQTDAIVTGPISKASWALAGHDGAGGHTEMLGRAFPDVPHGMFFLSPELRVMLTTIHIPLREVASTITPELVRRSLDLAALGCAADGLDHPRLVVCGINPHAGEGGLLGHEDDEQIRPAIELARADGLDVTGPLAAEAAFVHAHAGRYDCVVAMYHDQGLIPVKLLARDRAVNLTVGLPIVRTSPAHGTAFDIAGQGIADAGSMRAAVDAAIRLVNHRRSLGGDA